MGYAGGELPDPTYRQMGDHSESLQIDFDPQRVSYLDLLAIFWEAHNPFGARGRQYGSGIFCADRQQLDWANATADLKAKERDEPIKTRILELDRFYYAEDYHQKYRLRRERALCDELIARFGSDRAMVDSTEAARINGYLGGYGRLAALRDALPQLGLSEGGAKQLMARVA